jgi:hypothetical protein
MTERYLGAEQEIVIAVNEPRIVRAGKIPSLLQRSHAIAMLDKHDCSALAYTKGSY